MSNSSRIQSDVAAKTVQTAIRLYYYQIEVSTRCNYDCWYCAGRSMEQADMSFDRFMEIVEKIPKGSMVALQGEGEPTLWRYFEQAVEYLASRGFTPYAIINGSIIYPELFNKHFPIIGVSVDTLIPEVASKIGRHGLTKVLRNIQTLKETMGAHRIKVHTTYNGQDVGGLVDWVKSNGFIHFVQKVNKKSDYAVNYKDAVLLDALPVLTDSPKFCDWLETDKMTYQTIDGVELPCCFIKDANFWPGKQEVRMQLATTGRAKWCDGCRFLWHHTS